MGAIQGDCTNNTIDTCYALIAISEQARAIENTIPPVYVSSGFTLLSQTSLLGERALTTVHVPIGRPDNSQSSFSITVSRFSQADMNLVSNANPLGKAALPHLVSFGLNSGLTPPKLVYSIDFIQVLPLAFEAFKQAIPGLKVEMPSIFSKPMDAIDKTLKQFNMKYEINADFLSKGYQYFALIGKGSPMGVSSPPSAVSFLVGKSAKGIEILVTINLDNNSFDDLITKVLPGNPLKLFRALSRFQVLGYVASADIILPSKVTMPEPYRNTVSFKKGFCVNGIVLDPQDCGLDPICGLFKLAFAVTPSLQFSGCVTDRPFFYVSLPIVELARSVTLTQASLEFHGTTLESVTALDVTIGGNVVTFGGSIGCEAPAMSLELQFWVGGMIQSLFGLSYLHVFDLTLGGKASMLAGFQLTALNIGGGLCFGEAAKCRQFVSSMPPKVALLQGTSVSPQNEDYAKHTTFLQQANLTGAISGKVYVGISVTGQSYLYAGITKVTLADISNAIVGSSSLPDFMGNSWIEGYDQAECLKSGGQACFAFFSVSTMLGATTLDQLKPALVIPTGFNIQGRMQLFGTGLGFQLRMAGSRMKLAMNSDPIKLFDGKILICQVLDAVPLSKGNLNHNKTLGPVMNLDVDLTQANFKLDFNAFAKLGSLAEGGVIISVSPSVFRGSLVGVSLFGGAVTVDANVQFSMPRMDQFQIAVAADVSGLKGVWDLLIVLTDYAAAPVLAALDTVKAAQQVVAKAFDSVNNKLQDIEKRLVDDKKDCQDRKDKLDRKDDRCDEKRLDKKIACNADVKVDKAALEFECVGVLTVAKLAVQVAQKVVELAQTGVNKALAAVAASLQTAADAIQFLTKYQPMKVGFKALGLASTVTLSTVIRNTQLLTDTEYLFEADLSGVSLQGMAKMLLSKIFQATAGAATAQLTSNLKKVNEALSELLAIPEMDKHSKIELSQVLELITINHKALSQAPSLLELRLQ